jgi:diazepam-binding inhibitor (GABA receptor modulator, acyl-CoA-binding protein)
MTSSLQNLFDHVVNLVRETPATSEMILSNEDKLRLYGLYKHATVGDCSSSGISPPYKWNIVARAKYDAWNSYRDLDREEAMIRYIRLVSSQNHWLGKKCHELLLKYEQGRTTLTETKSDLEFTTNENMRDDQKMISLNTSMLEKKNLSNFKECYQVPLWQRILGIQQLVPRGQLDISFMELACAAFHCLQYQTAPKRDVYESMIASTVLRGSQNHDTVVVGLSVRSLLDLYLRAVNYPPGSEIIIAPPINILSIMISRLYLLIYQKAS